MKKSLKTKKTKTCPNKQYKPLVVISCVIISIALLCFFSALWFRSIYGNMDFDSVLFTVFGRLEGVQSDFLINYIVTAILPTILCSFLVCFAFFFKSRCSIIMEFFKKRIKLYPVNRIVMSVISIILSCATILFSSNYSGLTEYITAKSQDGNFYEKYYVTPNDVSIEFPTEKRNLIYIFLESMETTFFSKAQGGALDTNIIPELYGIAKDNISFSYNNDVGGLFSPYGTTWTIAAMTAQTAGVHLHIPTGMTSNTLMDYFDDFLPGATTLHDILDKNGYDQMLVLGSDASFGGRREYFSQHGVGTIYDLNTAREEGYIPEDYYVWWGMEDQKFLEYAKQKLTEISSDTSRPFSFTMLTTDTHHIGGYVCPLCKTDHAEQYENVFSCSSRQISALVEWIKQQPFYENTTIVICGDHPSMDGAYIGRQVPETYTRHIYNCIINSAVDSSHTKQRLATSFDMFPTTLAALGCTIEGDKLALGTNLFSGTKTLLEEIGSHEELNLAISQNSTYYTEKFMY